VILEKTPHKSMFLVNFKKLNSLKGYNEMDLVTSIKVQGKLSNRGTMRMFVRYRQIHLDDVHHLLNTKARQIIKSRDLIWFYEDNENWDSKKKYN
jgi:hypothetical protein